MHVLRMPSLGETMEWGILIQHHVAEGKSFSIGNDLYELENEKTTLVVEAMTDGTVARWTAPLGEELPVGTVIAVIAGSGEEFTARDIDELLATETGVEATTEPDVDVKSTGHSPGPVSDVERIRAMPKVRARATELGIDF